MDKHRPSTKKLLVLAGLILFAVFLWAIMPKETPAPYTAPVTETSPTDAGGGTLYADAAYGLSLRYDGDFVVTTDTSANPWQHNSAAPGTRLFSVALPKEFQPQTNFSSAEITVGASTDKAAVDSCLVATNGEVAKGASDGFAVFSLGDAGAGNYYETESHRMIRDGACLSVESVIHSVNVMNYPAELGIREFDHALVQQKLRSVFDSIEVR